jgi:hypothetical protein
MADDGLPHHHRFVQIGMAVERCVLAVSPLDNTGNFDEVYARPIVKSSGDGRARDDEHVETAIVFNQSMGDCPAPAQMP